MLLISSFYEVLVVGAKIAHNNEVINNEVRAEKRKREIEAKLKKK